MGKCTKSAGDQIFFFPTVVVLNLRWQYWNNQGDIWLLSEASCKCLLRGYQWRWQFSCPYRKHMMYNLLFKPWFKIFRVGKIFLLFQWSEKEKISSERQLCGWKCLVDVRGQRRMGRLVRDDRKPTVTQITTRYNQGIQNTISERTTRWTLKQMGYSRPHRVPLLSTKNRKQRLQFAQAHQNWTIEDWKNVAWSDESRYLLRHSEGRVRIWHKEHESMAPSCLVSTVQAGGGGVMVWGIFYWHTLGPLVPIEHRLNTTAYLSIVTMSIPLWLQCTHLLKLLPAG